ESLSVAQHHREDHDVVLINQVVLDQRLQKMRTAVDLERRAILLLEALDVWSSVSPDDLGWSPVRTIERVADDVLGRPVQWSVTLFSARLGPMRGKDLVGLASQEEIER